MKKFNLVRHAFVMAGAGLAMSLTLTQPAVARNSAGADGMAAQSDMACMSLWFATMTNNCNHVVSFDWPLVVDGSGNKTVTVTAYGASSSNTVGCRAEGLNNTTTTVWYSNGGAYSYLSSFGSPSTISLTGSYVPGGGYLVANCQLNTGGRVHTANWNP